MALLGEDTRQAATALAASLRPRSVAVVGAGRTNGVGANILGNLLATFRGQVFPVNPNASTIGGVACYPAVSAIPEAVDLAVVAVPPACVDAVIDDCIRAKVSGVIVITAGFGETGGDGRARETAIRDRLRRAGIRLIGPNCLGIVNTDPNVCLNASFSPTFPPAGPVAFVSQSGALGLAVLETAAQLGLGISSFVSIGNHADVSFEDLLEYWEGDPRTTAILVYAESFANPRRFATIARRVSRLKPVVVLKAGRSPAGSRAALSHTGALAAGDALVDAMLRDAGVVRVDTLEALFATATLLAYQPLPRGPRVAILTNAGGPGILAADACEPAGLDVAALSTETLAALKSFLPPTAGLGNPIDMIATASPEHYHRAIPLLLQDPGVDALIAMFIPLSASSPADVAGAIATAAHGSDKPVLATFFGAAGVSHLASPVPCYTFPEIAVRALANAVASRRLAARPEFWPPALDRVDHRTARPIIERALAARNSWLGPDAAAALLAASGIAVAPTRIVTQASDAVTAARSVGYPVVLKGSGPSLIHKTEAHAVKVGLTDDDAVTRAFCALRALPDVTAVIVQPMVGGGVEMFVGASRDEVFGHTVVCGSGGVLVELMKDTALRLAPLTDEEAAAMLDGLRGIRLLRGFRGAPVLDEAALKATILGVSALVGSCPEIVELDLNPVIVTVSGAVVVDARIRLG
jgi:acetyl coenzyme A synthetase (ADP forming)-like protein